MWKVNQRAEQKNGNSLRKADAPEYLNVFLKLPLSISFYSVLQCLFRSFPPKTILTLFVKTYIQPHRVNML